MSKYQKIQDGFKKKTKGPIKINGFSNQIDDKIREDINLKDFYCKNIQLSQNELVNTCFNYYVKMREDNSSAIINQLPSKFVQIQNQIIQVVQFRKHLQKERQISILQDRHFQSIHKLIQRNKKLQETIDILGQKIKQLQNQLLNSKYFPETNSQVLQGITISRQESIKKSKKQFKDDFSKIFTQISYIKKSIQNFVTIENQNSILSNLNIQNSNNSFQANVQNQKSRPLDQNGRLETSLKIQSKQLQMRLEILQQGSSAQNNYLQSQNQIIQCLMTQLIQAKKQIQKYQTKLTQARKTIDQGKIQTFKLEESQSNLGNKLFQELVKIKKNQQRQEKVIVELEQNIKVLQQKRVQKQSQINQNQRIIELKELQLRQQKLKFCQIQYKVKQQQTNLQLIDKQKDDIIHGFQEKSEIYQVTINKLEGKCQLLQLNAQFLRKEHSKLQQYIQKLIQQIRNWQKRFEQLEQSKKKIQFYAQEQIYSQREKLSKLEEKVVKLIQQNSQAKKELKNSSIQKQKTITKLRQEKQIKKSQVTQLKELIQKQKEQNTILKAINDQLQLQKQQNIKTIYSLAQIIENAKAQIRNFKIKEQKYQKVIQGIIISQKQFSMRCTTLQKELVVVNYQRHKMQDLIQNTVGIYNQNLNSSIQKYDQLICEVIKDKKINGQCWSQIHKLLDKNNQFITLLECIDQDQQQSGSQYRQQKSFFSKQAEEISTINENREIV